MNSQKLKNIFFVIFSFILFSCNYILKEEKNNDRKSVIDTTNGLMVESIDNKKECDLKAGYKWSNLQSKCVRVFDEGSRLTSEEKDSLGNGTNAYFFIDSDSLKAEVFLPESTESIILERDSEDENFKKENIEFQTKNNGKSYQIMIDNKVVFKPAVPTNKTNLGKTEEQ